MAVLQRAIAEQLGISQMTVSRALRGQGGISEKTRTMVLSAARKAGLALPPSPRLLDHKSLLHALCIMGDSEGAAGSGVEFFGRLHDGMRRGARECASEIMSCPESVSAWPAVVARKQVDGVVLLWGDNSSPLPQSACPVPQVYLFDGPGDVDVVTVDNYGGGLQLGAYLGEMGHRRVAFVGPETKLARERLAGLRTGLERFGGVCPLDAVRLRARAGGQGSGPVDDLLGGETRPEVLRERFTAIMFYNDFFAVHGINRLRELGVRVPEDISVAGFDGVSNANHDTAKLCTCAIPLEELGAEATRFVYWRIEHPNAVRRTLVLGVDLVRGNTVSRVTSEK
ncbi:MAG: LacI family transcriptional regulator [Lentisphaerae bacterium]|nr:LacI family transcriptional regulator [Lentisphaerota bacterium]